jgi:hypothetical protein
MLTIERSMARGSAVVEPSASRPIASGELPSGPVNGFTEIGGTLLSADGGSVLGHVNDVRVAGVPGTFECQPDVAVERGKTYALGAGAFALVVQVEGCWIDATRRRHANGRVLRQLSDVPGISRPHE